MASRCIFKLKHLVTSLFFILCLHCSADSTAKREDMSSVSSLERVINVYYFHTYKRCYSCKMIEKFTKETINTHFMKELKDSTLSFKLINVELKENSHLVTDYKLITKSIIVAEVIHGKETRWKNLDKIWQLLQNPPEFKKYIKNEIRMYLD